MVGSRHASYSAEDLEPEAELARLRRARANRRMLAGAAWFFGGLGLTVWSYAAAADGGTYGVFWGAMAYGLVTFFRAAASA